MRNEKRSFILFSIFWLCLTACDTWNPGTTETMEESFTNSFGMIFNRIPAGTFMMGSPESELGRFAEEEIQHQVTLTQDFYIQTTEVTQKQWSDVINQAEQAGILVSGTLNKAPSYFSACGENCPVEGVAWDDVQIFITALNTMGERTYALPTEAQWEYAARSGSTTALANGDITAESYDFDKNLDLMGWYSYNAEMSTHPVARKSANDWGLYDMHGNVWEWCQDRYEIYPSSPVIDPLGPLNGSGRLLRGGAWNSYIYACRSANRGRSGADSREYSFGFRLVVLPIGEHSP